MNIKTAERLMELRKKNGFSQEDLANELGVSRQAISKWERCESSPDTDNLILLAKLYNMTLDELLNGDEAYELVKELKESDKDVKMDVDATHDEMEDEEKAISRKSEIIYGTLEGACGLVIAIAYLLIGFLVPFGFGNYWFLFILIPVIISALECIKKRSIRPFSYSCLVTAIYCAIGMLCNIWHPTWVLFLTIPLYNAFVAICRKK